MKPTMTIYPFFIHAIFMSIFASVIGPFGGFFASGFKRAFKIKVRAGGRCEHDFTSLYDIAP